MIKLERIYIKNYKNIAEADLELENMNVIVGENGSGKSNLLSVIPFLNYIINGSFSEVKFGFETGGNFLNFGNIWNYSLSQSPRTPLILKIEFSNSDTNVFYFYEIHFESNVNNSASSEHAFVSRTTKILFESFSFKLKSKTGKAISLFKRQNNEVTYGDGIKKNDSIINNLDEYTSVIRLLNLIQSSENISIEYQNCLVFFGFIFKSNIYYLSSQLLNNNDNRLFSIRTMSFNLSKEIEELSYTNQWEDYQKALKQIILIDEILITDLRSISKSFGVIISVIQNQYPKPFIELSDGTLVLLALITKIFSDSSDIFFIEEPENSIHPKALYELMKLIRERSVDKQFIITTHSPYLLNMIKPEEVLVAEICDSGLSTISKLPDVKAIKKRLAKSFMSFGDIVFAQPDTEDGEEKVY
jgi:predicted ATPase